MLIKNQNDILNLLKLQMRNSNKTQVDISNKTGVAKPHVSRTFSNKHNVSIDTLIAYVDAIDAQLDINITPKQTVTDSTNKDKQ